MLHHLVVQWPRLGPYHVARLRALGRVAAEQGRRVTALETASQDRTYAWDPHAPAEDTFERTTVFPGASFEDVPPRRIAAGVRAALGRLNPDAVAINSYSLPDALAALRWCRDHRRVAICMTDSKADDGRRRPWREALKAHIVGQFDAALLAGTPQQAYFEGLGFPSTAIRLGYDVVDNAYFATAREARPDPDVSPGPHFLAANRFVRRKGLDVLLEAYARYRARVAAPWHLVLLGDGPERAALEAQIQTLGLAPYVSLPGFAQLPALPGYYGRASAFVHPALQDQWGLVVNEAMAAGLPVIVSTAAGCARDLVDEGGNGYRVPPGDAGALADALVRLGSHPPETLRTMGEASRAIIAAWTPERFAAGLLGAAEAGERRARRGLSPLVRALLWTMRQAPSASTFHALREP